MDTKLTLNMDRDIVQKAKTYARSQGRSLSDLLENYLRLVLNEDTQDDNEISPVIKSLQGSLKVPEDFDYKKERTDYLIKKYLKE